MRSPTPQCSDMYRLSEYTWDLISTHAEGKGSCRLAQTCQAGRRAAGRGRDRTKSKDVENMRWLLIRLYRLVCTAAQDERASLVQAKRWVTTRYPGQAGRRPMETMDGLKYFKDLADQPHLRFVTLRRWQRRDLAHMLAQRPFEHRTSGILYWVGAFQAMPERAVSSHGGTRGYCTARQFYTPLIPRISATAVALEALWHTLGSLDSARKIELYLRRHIIPDVRWNPEWDGISSITAKSTWEGRVGHRSFDYQTQCQRCSLPCWKIHMKRGESTFTTDCGCTDGTAVPTDEIQNMREPDFTWMIESWGQINHEEWRHMEDVVSDHHERDCALTEEQRARCGLWRWGQRLHARVPIPGEPQSHWMITQTLPTTPLFRSGREQRLLEADNTRRMLEILLTRTARKVEIEHVLLPQKEGFRGEDRAPERVRQDADRADRQLGQGITPTRGRQRLSCFWWRSWLHGRRERRIERPIQGWGRDDGWYEEKEEGINGEELQEVSRDKTQASAATRRLRSTGHSSVGHRLRPTTQSET